MRPGSGATSRPSPWRRRKERYDPKAGDFGLSISGRSGSEKTASVSLGPSLRVPTGGNFRLSWRKPVAGPGDRSGTTSLTFSQPLLKGFGPEIDTWTLRSARLAERINVRAFRDRVSGIVGSVIGAYRGVLSAERRLTIAREALQRAERQLEINRALVEAGRMAPRELVQAESSVANRQYSLTDAEVALNNASAGLINTLDLEEGVRVVPSEEPPVEPETPDLGESMETAFARRTDWLSAEIGLEMARMGLRIAEDNLLPDLSLNITAQRGGDTDPVYRRPAGDGDNGAAVERPAPGAGTEALRSYPACGACRSIALSRSVCSSRWKGSRSSAARRATNPVRQQRRPKSGGGGLSGGAPAGVP